MSGKLVYHRFLAGVDIDDVGAMLRSAGDALGRGNLGWAEAICQMVLERDALNGHALNFLALTAHRVGAFEQSAAYGRQALEAAGEVPQLRKNLLEAEKLLARAAGAGSATDEKVLVIKAWGEGFWSDVDHVLGCCLLAEITGRAPVTDWGAASRYGDDAEGDAFVEFFEPLSGVRASELNVSDEALFPPKWTSANFRQGEVNRWSGPHARAGGLYFLARPERVAVSDFHVQVRLMMGWLLKDHMMWGRPVRDVYRYLVKKYLRCRDAIAGEVRVFVAQNFGAAPYIAVHVRGSDKGVEMPEIGRVNETYHDVIGRLDGGVKIFLLTDSAAVVEEYRARYGDRVVTTGAERSGDSVAVHFKGGAGSGVRRGREVMVDTYVAAGARWFVGNGRSNVSAMVEHLKDWGEGEFFLVAPNQHYEINASIWAERL